jgi:hypothetical protein
LILLDIDLAWSNILILILLDKWKFDLTFSFVSHIKVDFAWYWSNIFIFIFICETNFDIDLAWSERRWSTSSMSCQSTCNWRWDTCKHSDTQFCQMRRMASFINNEETVTGPSFMVDWRVRINNIKANNEECMLRT